MSFNNYDFGSAIVLTGKFADVNGNPLAPTNVRLRVMDPGQLENTYTSFSNPTTGTYNYTLTVMKAGVWYYRFEGDGAVVAVGDQAFNVNATPFPDAMP
jgi:hypothetical protein